MTLNNTCLKQWNTPNFEKSFFAAIRENQDVLHLEAACTSGGTIQDDRVEYTDLKADDETSTDALVEGSFAFSFTEQVPRGCSDLEKTHEQSGRLYFSLNLKNGEVTFGHSQHLDMTGE